MPKFLCLPGYLQSGKVFAEKSSGLRKILTKKLNYELDYLDPPILIKSKEELPFQLSADETEANEKWNLIVENNLNRCWWVHTDEGGYKGFHDALDYVVQYIKEKGPYDGIIGFSQGAAMSAAIANSINSLIPGYGHFKVAILFSGFAFTTPVNKDTKMVEINQEVTDLAEYTEKVTLVDEYKMYFSPPLDFTTKVASVYGSEDMVVPEVRSKYLNKLYSQGTIYPFEHDGGHYLPNKKQFLNPIVDMVKAGMEIPPSL